MKKEVGDLPFEDAEEICEEKNGDFKVRPDGTIYVIWNDKDENDGQQSPIEKLKSNIYTEAMLP